MIDFVSIVAVLDIFLGEYRQMCWQTQKVDENRQ